MDAFWEAAGIPILLFVLCFYYGIQLIITGDASSIRGKRANSLKDEKRYSKCAGILTITLGVGSLLMGVLSMVNAYLGFIVFVVCVIVVFVLWKKMSDKYGE